MIKANKITALPANVTLPILFWSFLKIGATSFGGFMALLSVVQKELVEKKQLIKDQVILDATSLASVLPGPMAINVIAYIGYSLKGIKGAIVSMLGIILPSFLFMILLSFIYIKYGQLPILTNFFIGVLPAVIAIIASVATNMAKKHIKDYKQVLICLVSIIALLFIKSIFSTFIIIIGSGFLGYIIFRNSTISEKISSKNDSRGKKQLVISLIIVVLIIFIIAISPLILTGKSHQEALVQRELMLTFSGISVTLFGGGYVIIPAMQEIIVTGLHWLTKTEFADAIAMGQLTPGPIFISATFIGYKVGGLLGAITATLSIFIPPALIMIFFTEFLRKIRKLRGVKAAFKGIRPAVIGMIFSAAYTIGKSISIDWFSTLIFLAVLIASIKYKIEVIYLIPLSGIAGILFYHFY